MFESMGDDLREIATIDGVEIVRRDGKYWISAPYAQWANLTDREVGPALNVPSSLNGQVGSEALMPLAVRPTGFGAGIDKDRQDFTVESWRVNSPFSLLAGKTRVRN